jgi:quercetin dioxygenase-like cupin family protein
MAVQQAPGLWRTDLQQHDLSVPGHEVVQARVDIGPEAPFVKHTHPGEETIHILEGSLEYQVDGQPPKTCNAGDALTVPAGVVHAVRTSAAATPPNWPPTSSRKASRSSPWSRDRQASGTTIRYPAEEISGPRPIQLAQAHAPTGSSTAPGATCRRKSPRPSSRPWSRSRVTDRRG